MSLYQKVDEIKFFSGIIQSNAVNLKYTFNEPIANRNFFKLTRKQNLNSILYRKHIQDNISLVQGRKKKLKNRYKSYKNKKIYKWDKVLNPKNLSALLIEQLFYKSIESLDVTCDHVVRVGNEEDGGWNVCIAPPFNFMQECYVYSFGIGNDFSFDDEIASKFGCDVYSFDPSIGMNDMNRSYNSKFYKLGLGTKNGINNKHWLVKTFSTIRKYLKHTNKTIDILKMDIEGSEFQCLKQILSDDNKLSSIKQLLFELHLPNFHYPELINSDDYFEGLQLLQHLQDAKFKKVNFRINPFGKFQSKLTNANRSSCYELTYINSRFLL